MEPAAPGVEACCGFGDRRAGGVGTKARFMRVKKVKGVAPLRGAATDCRAGAVCVPCGCRKVEGPCACFRWMDQALATLR